MKRKLFLLAFPLLALALGGCVKYNGKGSANPVSKLHMSISANKLSIVEGESATISAKVDQDVTVNWSITADDDIVATLSATEGLTITVNAVHSGSAVLKAIANYKEKTYTKTCNVSVTRKGQDIDPDIPDPDTPSVGEKVTTYLVIGENGRYQGQPGKDVPELFLEYAVLYEAKVGDALPTADDVSTIVTGSKFQYWQAYDGTGDLTKYDKVPKARGKILYACFGGGQGGVTPDPDPDVPSGTFDLYFVYSGAWSEADIAKNTLYLGANEVFSVASKVSTSVYKASVSFNAYSVNVNAYIKQVDGDREKYFHPYSGAKDYNYMNSNINKGSVNIADEGEYTITFGDWVYDQDDYAHAWFSYAFVEGKPGDTPTPGPTPPTPTETVTIQLKGIESWEHVSKVGFAVNGQWQTVTSKTDGVYSATFTVSTVNSINCYFAENNDAQYRHPYYEPFTWDTEYSTIVPNMEVPTGHTYAIVIPSEGTWGNNYEDWTHAWFNYTFTMVA